MTRSNRSINVALITFAAVTFVGCGGTPEKPVAELTRAKTLIEQAEQNGGQQYAAADLKRARDKLDQADDAAEKGEDNARELAVEAAADAELAAAKVRQAKAEEGASEVSKSVESVRQESDRSSTRQP